MAEPPDRQPELDTESARRVARSFLVVRLVRGGLLLVFLGVALVGVEVRGWPRAVSVAIVLAMLLLAGSLLASHRRYVRGTGPSGNRARRDRRRT